MPSYEFYKSKNTSFVERLRMNTMETLSLLEINDNQDPDQKLPNEFHPPIQ